MIRLVFVKLPNGKAEEFDATQLSLEAGENVIVETEKGSVLGKVLAPPHEKEKRFFLKSPKKVTRKATAEDLKQLQETNNWRKRLFNFAFRRPERRG